MSETVSIVLVGNPNSGKTSLFNALTGLNQKVGNFPGVTVDKKAGYTRLDHRLEAKVVDLPGTYSIYPRSADEWVTFDVLLNPRNPDRPDIVICLADASNIKRNLLFCSQIIDLNIPVVIALTMMDIAQQKGIRIDVPALELALGVPVVPVNPRKEKGITALKKALALTAAGQYKPPAGDFIPIRDLAPGLICKTRKYVEVRSDYAALLVAAHHEQLKFLNGGQRLALMNILAEEQFNRARVQGEEIMQRYQRIAQIMTQAVVMDDPRRKKLITEHIDQVLLHRFWGYVILLAVLFLLFQSIFWLAQYPMGLIEQAFTWVSTWLSDVLPSGWFSDLLINGLVAGLSGIAVFVPQIMILFGLITILEDTGYMARVSFLSDRLMRQVGLNGKSVMPLISGLACAVPAIMATRNIENQKERLITILVTPLMSCSARLPVYIVLISLVIPDRYLLGFLSLQGLVMMGLYLLGFFTALTVAWVMKHLIHLKEKSYFILELPVYRSPRWKNVFITMVQKARIFVTDAGKVIMVISLILWMLASYGPHRQMEQLKTHYTRLMEQQPQQRDALEIEYQGQRLEHSYAGMLGHIIEPVIRPLGFDWKIGIALITSFAAREVFVGTMATLYSVQGGKDADRDTLRQKLEQARRPDGTKVYTLPVGLSLMIFYVFAMQCMSTLAVVKRETKSWKFPLIQLAYMTSLAYVASFITYHIF
ncbi:ferrous iron transport protein B [Thermoflavifilum thermophilum]|uniref:Ferrous iron transport protein B n=1 Tax=Thermoflavifilum thermophilum TaxID=1393122 RepID=A0A1I7NB14_9BACT|nr:ferrous iron transport protein B [Thermoflavifilum thermophilum]SFV31860.1 ferrous iron transport protein B [Thermoflavifilum thermophilum]